MKALAVLVGCLLLETCRGMGAGEYCFSCDAGSKDSQEGRCNDKYTPPHNIKISPNICDDISKNVTEEHRLCKKYPNGYIFQCYTEFDGNFFNCKSSCTVPLEDVGKSIGIQDNLSKVMNNGLLAGFGSDGDNHPDLLSGLDLNMFKTDPGNNVHAPTLAGRRGGAYPSNQAGKSGSQLGYQPVPPPGAPTGAFNVNKPLMFQNSFPQYNYQTYTDAPQTYSGQNPRAGGYGNPRQYGTNGGAGNPFASLNQGNQGQYSAPQNHQGSQGFQAQYPTGQNPQGSQSYQAQYPTGQSPKGYQGQQNQFPTGQSPKISQGYQGQNSAGQSPQVSKHQYPTPPPLPHHVNHVSNIKAPPAPPLSNVHGNQGRVPNSYVPPSNPLGSQANQGSYALPPQLHQNHDGIQSSYPHPPPPPPTNAHQVPTAYVPPPKHQAPQHFSSGSQGSIQGGNQYNGQNNQDYGGAHASSGSNFGGKQGSQDNTFSRSMQGTLSKTGTGLKDQDSFNKAASRFGQNNFGMNAADFGKHSDPFHGFNSNADNGFGFGQYNEPKSSTFGQQSKAFDLLNSKMAKQNLLLNQKHSDGKSQNAASNTGGHLSNSKSNSFSKSSKSSSGKSGGSSFGVFDKTGLTNGKTGTHRGVGSRGRIGDIGNRYGHNQMFNNLGNFFRQPASKAGATIKDKNKFNFGSLDDFMNEEFRHNQDALQPIFNRNPFSNQGYGKLFPNENFQLASANRGNGKRSNSNSIPHSAGNLHTEYGRFFDFV